jgi:hypothetical protein
MAKPYNLCRRYKPAPNFPSGFLEPAKISFQGLLWVALNGRPRTGEGRIFEILRGFVLYAGEARLFSERLALASFDCYFIQNRND